MSRIRTRTYGSVRGLSRGLATPTHPTRWTEPGGGIANSTFLLICGGLFQREFRLSVHTESAAKYPPVSSGICRFEFRPITFLNEKPSRSSSQIWRRSWFDNTLGSSHPTGEVKASSFWSSQLATECSGINLPGDGRIVALLPCCDCTGGGRVNEAGGSAAVPR
jgi:hypothetical protein